jgi:hypothetical protein
LDLPYRNLDRVWFGFTQKIYSDVPPGDMASLELFDIGPARPAEGLLGPSVQRGQGLHGGLQLEQLSMLHRDLARDLLEQSRCPYPIPVLSLASVQTHDRLALVTRLAQKHAAAASGA